MRAEPPVERELVLVLVEGAARASLMARMLPLERLLQMPAHRQRK